MDFRVFRATVVEVVRQAMVKNGRKWSKWSKKVHRGYLVGNGFPRVERHSPTTNIEVLNSLNYIQANYSMADNELGYNVEYLNFDDMVFDKFGIHKLYIISGTKKKKKIMNF